MSKCARGWWKKEKQMTYRPFAEELKQKPKKEWYFREQTIVWKNPENGEFALYVSVILETHGFNRFDYAAFNYGHLPNYDDWARTTAIIHRCAMEPRRIRFDAETYLVDETSFSPAWKTYYTRDLHDAF